MLDYVHLCQFQDVVYFPQRCSDTYKISMQRKLTNDYIMDWNEQDKKAARAQQTQQLRDEPVTPTAFVLKRDYFQEQMDIQLSKVDADIFGHHNKLNVIDAVNEKDLDVGLKSIQMATMLAQDTILKLKDKQSFVQLVQKLNQMYQSHAVACVWFLKWIIEQ